MGIPLSVFKESEVQNIKACIVAGLFRTDEAGKWSFDKINQIVDFWKGKPFDDASGSYKFGSAILREIKDNKYQVYFEKKVLFWNRKEVEVLR